MKNDVCFAKYETYLTDVKKSSANTLASYLRDIRQLGDYLDANTDSSYDTADEAVLSEYINRLKANGKSVATVSRAIASMIFAEPSRPRWRTSFSMLRPALSASMTGFRP